MTEPQPAPLPAIGALRIAPIERHHDAPPLPPRPPAPDPPRPSRETTAEPERQTEIRQVPNFEPAPDPDDPYILRGERPGAAHEQHLDQVDAERFFIDWPTFWARDRRDADWLYEDVLARGRGHSIFAGHKVGKSLLTLAIVVQLVVRGVVVVYLDYEMGEDDLYDRLEDMGYGPDTDLSRLHYALLPSLPPLDEPEGAKALFAKVDAVAATYPAADVAVVIDTTGRAVAGEENSADTFRNFYRWTGLGLKQRGVTWARLDHAGKDAAKGQRGSSGKGDDVDVVWRLNRTANGLELKREASRMGWVPEKVAFRQMAEPLRFVRVAHDWPAGTQEVAARLDELGVPLDVGDRPAAKALRDARQGRKTDIVRAAQKWRRERAKEGQI